MLSVLVVFGDDALDTSVPVFDDARPTADSGPDVVAAAVEPFVVDVVATELLAVAFAAVGLSVVETVVEPVLPPLEDNVLFGLV